MSRRYLQPVLVRAVRVCVVKERHQMTNHRDDLLCMGANRGSMH